MGDWKSMLREIKKSLQSGTVRQDRGKSRADHTHKVDIKHKPLGKAASSVVQMAPPRPAEPQKKTPIRQAASSQPRVATAPAVPLAEESAKLTSTTASRPKGLPQIFHAAHRNTLTRQAQYAFPEPWVAEGARTQFSPKPGSLAVDIVIGLDFGTSYTKAAVGLKDQIFPVSWEGISATPQRYLLPSEYSVLGDGSCQLGQAPTATFEAVHQRLKHPFINAGVSLSSIIEASVFVALVLRYIRAWVYRTHGGKIRGSEIRWQFNVGAPSNGLETGRLEAAYKKLASIAWQLSQNVTDINLGHAREVAEAWTSDCIPNDLTDLSVVPEFVAQISGYVHSPQRKRGLHALVDVGGGTLDIVTFIVHKQDGEDVFPFLVPAVSALGTQILDLNRLVDAPDCDLSHLPDELQPVLSTEEYSRASGFPQEHIRIRDDMLWGAVRDVVKSVFHRTKQRRYRLSDAWNDGLPTFFTGGGSKVEGYQKAVKRGGEWHASTVNLRSLPPHPRLAEFRGETDDYQRISVACGLALDAWSLGHIKPAKDVEDDVPPQGSTVERLDRDELYAR